MKGLFIINPSSGKQNIDSMLREIMATLILDQICSHVDVFYTKGKDDAKNRAAELKPGDYDFIVSVGGDGTLNEVTNGLILSESNIPMAIISAGTVNDFATYMKLPQTADGFCQMIKDFQTKKVDVGRVNNEYFINVYEGMQDMTGLLNVSVDAVKAMGEAHREQADVIRNTVLINQDIADSIRNENEQFTAISAMAESNAGDTAEVAAHAGTINDMVNEMENLLKQGDRVIVTTLGVDNKKEI